MHGTVDLELANLSSDLTWKKVSKGNRSSSRRARSSVTRSFGSGEKLINKDCNTLDMSVSESEKLGVSVLGCHFNAKAVHVPIKKRKFMFRSPSPPPTAPSQHLAETESHLKSQPEAADCAASASDLGQIVDAEHKSDENNLVRVEKQVNKRQDFSGISILAAAACNGHTEDLYGVEESLARDASSRNNESGSLKKRVLKEDLTSAEISTEGTSCISGLPADELAVSSRTENSSANILPQESTEQNKSLQNPSMAAVADERVHDISLRDDRLHWDLNTSMDAWERPFGYATVDSEFKVADVTREDVKHFENSDKMGNSDGDTVQREPTDGYHGEKELIPIDSGKLQEQQPLITEELSLDSCANIQSTSFLPESLSSSGCLHSIAANTVSASPDGNKNAFDECQVLSSTGNSERLFSEQVAGLDLSVASSLPSAGTIVPKAICHDVSAGFTCVDNKDGCAGTTSEIILTSLQVEEEQVAIPVTLPGEATCETQDVIIEDGQTANEISNWHDDDNTSKNNLPQEAGCVNDGREIFCCQSNEPVLPPSSAVRVEMPDLAASAVDLNLHDDVPGPNTTGIGEMEHNECEELVTQSLEKYLASLHALSGFSSCHRHGNNSEDLVNNGNKKASEEPLNNGNSSDISHANHVYAKAKRFEEDYDSQYEDGEVRESIEHAWEDYEGEDMEAEHTDYVSDNVNLGCGAEEIVRQEQGTDFQPSPSLRGIDISNESGDNIRTEPKAGPKEVAKDSSNGGGMDEMKTVARNESSRKNVLGSCVARSYVEDQTTMVESRAFRRELRSEIEGRTYHDVSFRKDGDATDSTSRSERDPGYVESFGRGRFVQRIHARGRVNNRWLDSQDGSRYIKRHYSPNFHGSISYSQHVLENDVHLHLTRSGSPDTRDKPFGTRMRIRSSSDLSPGRHVSLGQGRSMRYGLTVDGRGPRLRYHGPVPDDGSLNHPNSLSKRERSFSPIERRRDLHVPQSHLKSPSRSRSRTPTHGNQSFRHRSQSPKFRSEFRIQRVRSPHQRPGLLADRMGGFRPIPRNHGSPPRSARWSGDRKDGVVHFRKQGFSPRSSFIERRSPGRLGRRDDRFDMVLSPRNFRPMHSGRFTEMDGVARGVLRYKGTDDDRGKHGYRYRLVHTAKPYDIDGSAKRFRYNVEDGFTAKRNSRYRDAADYHGSGSPKDPGRGIENRIGDVPRKFREDKSPFVYRREEKYDVDTKSVGVWGGNDDVASRRRPS